jgi:hypothetical protein
MVRKWSADFGPVDCVVCTDLRAASRRRELNSPWIDASREQLYGTTAGDTYRGQISRTLELVIQGDDSARPRIQELLDEAARDDQVMPDEFDALKRLVADTLGV